MYCNLLILRHLNIFRFFYTLFIEYFMEKEEKTHLRNIIEYYYQYISKLSDKQSFNDIILEGI